MADKSSDLADKVLAKVLTNTNFTVATVYVGLLVSSVEVSGGSYARQALVAGSWGAPAAAAGGGRIRQYGAKVEFPVASADWGEVDQWFLADALSGGNTLYTANLKKLDGTDSPVPINNGNQFKFDVNQLRVTEK